MKNTIKKAGRYFLNFCLLFVCLIPLTDGTSATPTRPEGMLTCQSPTVSETGRGSGSVSFGWNAVSGASGYHVWYVNTITHDGSGVFSTGSTSISFTGIPPGTYDFYFETVCGEEHSEYVVAEDIIII